MGHRSGTLGQLIADGHSVSATCSKPPGCGRALDMDVYDLAMQFGLRWDFIDRKPRIKCGHCGSNLVSYIVAPDRRSLNSADLKLMPPANFRASRPQDERDALALLFPRR